MTIPFWVHEDPVRGLALVRGRSARPLLTAVAGARFSVAGKGWVIPLAAVADLEAAAEHAGVPYRVKRVTT